MTYEGKRTNWAWRLVSDDRTDGITKLTGLFIAGLTSEEKPAVELTDDEIIDGVMTTPPAVIAARVGLPAAVVEALA